VLFGSIMEQILPAKTLNAVLRSGTPREFSVRKASAQDAASILRCLAWAFEPFRALYTPQAFADTVPTTSGLQQRLATMCLFVAECRNEVIGTIGFSKLNTEEGHIRGMAVPDWQGSEVAAALLAAAEAEMKQQDCTRVKLDTTEPLQQAMRFYQKHGFIRSGHVGDFFGMRPHEYVKQL
jgi:GNAT superfamily N-acetyltransferase